MTTLLDSVKYPPAALGQLYYRRWAMELSLRNLKTTLQMDQLSCKTPQNLEREIRMHFLTHNLVRRLMLEAARRHRVPLERVSFAGSLAAARRYGEAVRRAVAFTLSAQDPSGGGWRYKSQQAGDTSQLGWQLMALKSGYLAGLEIDQQVIGKARHFLDAVADDRIGSCYGYTHGRHAAKTVRSYAISATTPNTSGGTPSSAIGR